ncbi:MAG: bacteriohopanetetrol glucosamine biosynthesis glycosyltransferase HpnI [Elusimicrobia bacterium]|nr:bacteriohopanetetrol glucosamine biosynthesis glycosyltransferase HpnI [Elusimicrobiota bacterium]
MSADIALPFANFLLGAFGAAAYAIAAFTAAFTAASLFAAWRFRAARRGEAAGGGGSAEDWTPPLTILKPIRGIDAGMEENLASFLDQEYPRFQTLYCVQDPADPALPLLERLRDRFPKADVDIVISKSRIGYNPKVNNLSNAYGFVKHDFVMISDSDIRVGRDFLRRLVQPMRDPNVGLLTCFYRSICAEGFGSRLESLSVNAQFLPQTLVAAFLGGMKFAMGAVMLARRPAFEAAGGLEAMSEHLADDFVLGRAVAGAGYRVEFSPLMVGSVPERFTPGQQFAHLVRWSRTIRLCNPAGYAGTVVLHGGPLLLLYSLLGGGLRALAAFALLEAWRVAAMAWMHAGLLDDREALRNIPWLPLSDLLQFAAWAAGLSSASVTWRGESYAVTTGGRLVPRRGKADALRAGAV